MPEISEERLAYFEALEAISQRIIQPISQDGRDTAKMEYETRFARTWTDEEIEQAMDGTAIWDDRPKGWRKSTLLTYSRGYLVGRGIVGGNLGQYFSKFVDALNDPVTYWRRWRLSFLDMCKGAPCSDPCDGTYSVDEERMGLVCDTCHAFYDYEQVCEIVRKGEEARAVH